RNDGKRLLTIVVILSADVVAGGEFVAAVNRRWRGVIVVCDGKIEFVTMGRDARVVADVAVVVEGLRRGLRSGLSLSRSGSPPSYVSSKVKIWFVLQWQWRG
ncbi:hypothetical protein U1Q18_006193, partial [Sarracenia purpurea var. burkii]